MGRSLTSKEQKILKRFESYTLRKLDNLTNVSFEANNEVYGVIDPIVYEIAGTDTKLVFGGIGRANDLEYIRRLIEMQMKNNPQKDEPTKTEASTDFPREVDGEIEEMEGNKETEDNKKTICNEELEATEEFKIREEDIALLVDKEKISREKAIEVLKKNNNDVINALVELSNNHE